MKIAFVSLHTSPTEIPGQKDSGGMNVVIDEQAKSLSSMGHDVTVFTRASKNIPAGEHQNVYKVVALKAGPDDLVKEELPEIVPTFSRALRKYLEEETSKFSKFDVFHSHYWLSGWATKLALQKNNCQDAAHAITFHTVAAQKNIHLAKGDTAESALRYTSEKELFRRNFTIAMSKSELHALKSHYAKIDTDQINADRSVTNSSTVINPGVDTKLFQPTTLQSQKHGIVVLGRQQPLKGQDLALKAFLEMLQNHPHLKNTTRLVIAGEATPGSEAFTKRLKDTAKKHDLLGSSVIFLPAQPRKAAAELLASSQLTLIPSHSETFGLVALESAAAGTPVVAANVTGLKESVKNKTSGVLIDGRNPQEWAQVIAGLLTDGQLLNELSQTARLWAEKHSWQEHVKKLLKVYEGLCKYSSSSARASSSGF